MKLVDAILDFYFPNERSKKDGVPPTQILLVILMLLFILFWGRC